MSGMSRRCEDICSRTEVTLLAVQAESLARQDEEHVIVASCAFGAATMDLKTSLLAGFLLNDQEAQRTIDSALVHLDQCIERLALAWDSYELSERLFVGASDRDNLLVRREKVFNTIDFDALYKRLAATGAVLPEGVYWREIVQAVKSGGINSGRGVLAKCVRQLRKTIRKYRSELVKLKRQPLAQRTKALHRQTVSGAVTHMLWAKLSVQSVYLTMCIQEGSVVTFERDQTGVGLTRQRTRAM